MDGFPDGGISYQYNVDSESATRFLLESYFGNYWNFNDNFAHGPIVLDPSQGFEEQQQLQKSLKKCEHLSRLIVKWYNDQRD